MQEKQFKGTYTALITPFTKNDQVDWDALQFLINHQIESGIDGLVFVGTTGESPTLTHKEHHQILERSVEMVNGRCKVIHGTGSNSTHESLEFARVAKSVGADAHLVVAPYYNKPTQEGLKQHFLKLADSTDLPLIVYNIEGRSAVNVHTSTLLELAEHPNIIGVKEASGNFQQITEVIRHAPSDFTVLSGDDGLILSFMAAGGDGLISVISNAMPATTSQLIHLCLSERYVAARELYYLIYDLLQDLSKATNPIPIKTLMGQLHPQISSDMRLPLTAASTEITQLLQSHLSAIKEIEAGMKEIINEDA